MRFSKQYATFAAWQRAKPRTSKYARHIIKQHKEHPKRILVQLRGTKPTAELSRVAWDKLSTAQRRERILALDVLNGMRHGQAFKTSVHRVGIADKAARKHLGKTLVHRANKILAKPTDKIQRRMVLYQRRNGKVSITVMNNKDASTIGEYFSSVQAALRSGKNDSLRRFKRIKIEDAYGVLYRFETDLDVLYDLSDEEEATEYFEIYSDED